MKDYGHRYGRRPHSRPIGYRDLSFFETSSPPSAPRQFDPLKGASPFQMLGNGPDSSLTANNGNPVGDCGFVMTVNADVVTSAALAETFDMPSSNIVVNNYLAYNHGQDIGVQNSQLLPYWHRTGLWGSKIEGYGGVDFRNFDEAMAYCHAYLGLCTGIVVTEAMEEQTQADEPWDLTGTPMDDNVLGGHDVLAFALDNEDMVELATWGQRQKATRRWWNYYVEECDVVVTSALVEAKGDGLGLDVAKLNSYLHAMN